MKRLTLPANDAINIILNTSILEVDAISVNKELYKYGVAPLYDV